MSFLIAVPAVVLWLQIQSLNLAVTPVLAAIEIWLVCSVIAVYMFTPYWHGIRDMVTVDTRSYASPGGGLVFRAKVLLGRALLLWGAATGLFWGFLIVTVSAADYTVLIRVFNAQYVDPDTFWVRVGAIAFLLGVVCAGVWLILQRVPPGLAVSREGLLFRRGLSEERRGWGEVRSVTWGGSAGMFGRLRIDFYEDRPLRRSSVSIGSNVELVGRLIDFCRANPKHRGSLDDLDRAVDTFEMHH